MTLDVFFFINVQLPVYNAEKCFYEVVKGIFVLLYLNFEVFFLNYGLTDGATEIIETYEEKNRRTYLIFGLHELIGPLNRGFFKRVKDVVCTNVHDEMRSDLLTRCNKIVQRMNAQKCMEMCHNIRPALLCNPLLAV